MIGKIEGTGPIRHAQPVRRASKSSDVDATGFAKHMDAASEADSAAPAHAMGQAGAVSGVLGAQEVDDALARAARGKLRAEDMLDKLDEIRMGVLSGTLSKEKLMKLSQVVNSRRAEISDPRLVSLLDEIDLRARVEIAKYAPPER